MTTAASKLFIQAPVLFFLSCVSFLILNAGTAIAQVGDSESALNAAGFSSKVGEKLPRKLIFRDEHGHPIELNDVFRSRPTILCPVYFQCPMLCKLGADGLIRSAATLDASVGEDFNIVFVSFDHRDDPKSARAANSEALRKYDRGSSGAGWYFLTGSQENIDRITDAIGFNYRWDPRSEQFAHASGIVFISPNCTITEYMYGVSFKRDSVARGIDRAGKGVVLESEPGVFLKCFLYDPTTGALGTTVIWTLRAACVSTVIAVFYIVIRLIRKNAALTHQSTRPCARTIGASTRS